MSVYIVYDKATGAILKTGVAPNADACDLQVDDQATQAVVSGQDDAELAVAKENAGVR